jgi:hypothetical protein
MEDALRAGRVRLWLDGEKLHGGYALTRIAKGQATRWLLVKKDDEFAETKTDILSAAPESVNSLALPRELHKPRARRTRYAFGAGLACSTVIVGPPRDRPLMTGARPMATAEKTFNPEQISSIKQQLSRENTPDSPVVQELRRQVANAFVLYANYKHYHWQTSAHSH